MRNCRYAFLLFVLICACNVNCQKLVPVDKGWSQNSVNTVVFRQNSLVTQKDTQFIAYYTALGKLALGKRHINDNHFVTKESCYYGNVVDAHNCISIMLDGEGYLHVSWDHHGDTLRYAKGVKPYSLELGEKTMMTGKNETNVTYPQFFTMPNGNLMFMYRDGQSGRGNLVVNSYDTRMRKWTQLQSNLIDGENKRNAYWQACVDKFGVVHVSWVWRETWDVETNHDMCYARSLDGGKTWENSKGEIYNLPINASTAEYAARIPQNSELINQTSMTTDEEGRPIIASYWCEPGSDVPQYHLIKRLDDRWEVMNLAFRKQPFSLSGGGTKRIPISRPQIVVRKKGKESYAYLIFRDEERGSKVSVAINKLSDKGKCKIKDLSKFSVGSWEPSFDTELWKNKKRLHLFVQNVDQVDAEGKSDIVPQMINVIEVKE